MERLTTRDIDGSPILLHDRGYAALLGRLAAYEDTGLTPEGMEARRLTGYDDGLVEDLEGYCRDHRHPKWTRELVKRAAESIAGKNEYRGGWETYKSGEHTECVCSACKKSYYYHNKGQYQINKSRYCPNCGARMDGGVEEET